MSSGAVGAITGLANAYPRCCLGLFNLLEEGNKTEEVTKLQARISNAEYGMGGRGLAGVKWTVGVARRYERAQKMDNEISLLAPRRPLRQLGLEGKQWVNERVLELHGLEAELKNAESWSGKGETNGTRGVNGGP
jgi:4-hydroxy-2-oxoglutarate aldolase